MVLTTALGKKLVNLQFLNLAQLAEKVRQLEQLKAEKDKIERIRLRKTFRKEQVNFIEVESDEDEDDFDSNEINLAEVRVAELQTGPSYVCASLKPVKGKEKANISNKFYSFNITKVDQIFDVLLNDKHIILLKGKKMPSVQEMKNLKFCKYHQIVGHLTNNCVRFRDLIQKATKEGRLKFEEKPQSTMTVDVNPFEIDSTFVKLVFMSINAMGFDEDVEEKMKEDMKPNAFENTEKPIYPKAREDLLNFLLKQRDTNANVTICPRYSGMFDKNAAKIFKNRKRMRSKRKKKR